MNYMFLPLRRYADFNGRSRRKEFWLWTLFNVIVVGILGGILAFMVISAVDRVADRGGIDRYEYSDSRSDRGSRYSDDPESDYSDRDSRSSRDEEADSEYSSRSDRDYDRDYRSGVRYSYGWEYVIDPLMLTEEFGALGWVMLSLLGLWWLVMFIPNLAVAIRRLHDTDKSGWMYLLVLIPLVGGIILLVFYCTEGTRGPNRFGPDPKGPDIDRTFT